MGTRGAQHERNSLSHKRIRWKCGWSDHRKGKDCSSESNTALLEFPIKHTALPATPPITSRISTIPANTTIRKRQKRTVDGFRKGVRSMLQERRYPSLTNVAQEHERTWENIEHEHNDIIIADPLKTLANPVTSGYSEADIDILFDDSSQRIFKTMTLVEILGLAFIRCD